MTRVPCCAWTIGGRRPVWEEVGTQDKESIRQHVGVTRLDLAYLGTNVGFLAPVRFVLGKGKQVISPWD